MEAMIEENQPLIAALCRRFAVKRLDLFGSAASESEFDPEKSDLDFLVEFERTESMGPADQYFGLLEELGDLFERPIDLVTARSLRNPYFIKSVNKSRRVLYAS